MLPIILTSSAVIGGCGVALRLLLVPAVTNLTVQLSG